MASYTGHGHHIPGTPEKIAPKQRKNCGGPELCLACADDVIRVVDGKRNRFFFSNPAGDFSKREKTLMTETAATPAGQQPIKATVLNKAVNALHQLGHDLESAETIVVHLLKSGIILKDADEVTTDVSEAGKIVNEAAPVLEAAEPTLAPEVESVQTGVNKVVTDEADADAEAAEFINEASAPVRD